jgi:hypothetical protein
MPHPGDKIRIPLFENEALRLFGKVKPTKDMPRPGANPTKPKKKARTKTTAKRTA